MLFRSGVDTRTPAFLHRGDEVEEIESVPGDYTAFYIQVKNFIKGDGDMPVSLDDALAVSQIIESARKISIR